jgi:hypothetical protein
MRESEGFIHRTPLINLAVGILTLISPWVLHPSSTTAVWDMFFTGIVIAVIALVATNMHAKNYWPSVNALLGVWLLISITFCGGQLAMVWSNLVLGVVAIVTGLVSQSYETLSTHRAIRT